MSGEVEGDGSIAFELEIVGAHTEPLVGPDGAMPATGKQIALPAANLWKVALGATRRV